MVGAKDSEPQTLGEGPLPLTEVVAGEDRVPHVERGSGLHEGKVEAIIDPRQDCEDGADPPPSSQSPGHPDVGEVLWVDC